MSARLPLTPSQTIGPFWHALGEPHLAELGLPGAPAPLGELAPQSASPASLGELTPQIAPPASLGELSPPAPPALLGELAISVRDGSDAPVTDACLELWCPTSSTWARAATDAQGVARFRLSAAAAVAPSSARSSAAVAAAPSSGATLAAVAAAPSSGLSSAPSSSAPPSAALVPPPLSVIVLARGLLKPLWTRLFFDEASLLRACPELSSLAPARRATLLADASSRPHWRWQLRLQGDAETETVFFDW